MNPTIGAQTPADGAPAGGSQTILVVDDNHFGRRTICQLLTDAGFHAVEASTGAEAIQLLGSRTDIRLMTLDVEMPDMDGFETLARIRSSRRTDSLWAADLPVILVTAHDTYQNRCRGFELGATDFVTKEKVSEQLVLTARALLTPQTMFSEMTVLVAEDSLTARHAIVSCVRQLGVRVLAAPDGQEAFEILRARSPAVDLVLTDMHMPRMTGADLCRRARFELGMKELPVIVLSGTTDHEAKLSLFQAGATDYLEKPFIKEELLARLQVHLLRLLLDHRILANLKKLRELDKLKDQFLAVCSHALRSPLTGILGYAQLLSADATLSAEQCAMAREIQQSGRFLLELINDLLDLSRVQAQKEGMSFEPLDPAAALRQIVGSFRPVASGKGIVLELAAEIAPGTYVLANRKALPRIFANLLSNAIKFTPAGGRVSLRMQPAADGRQVLISFADTGIGIPSHMITHLFSRYSKLSREGTAGEKGTGLGLMITRELVESHGGQLTVQSEEGKGTTFTMQLTVCDPPAASAPSPAPAAMPAGRRKSLRILLAEDQAVNARLMRILLEKNGHVCQVVANGREAVAQYGAAQSAPFDLALMDIEMPVMDGRQALVKIREQESLNRLPRLPVVALTAHTGEQELGELRSAGFDEILAKPVETATLNDFLRRFCDG
ncbi:MAG: response regulator [bacterium]